jgi:pyruvate kinase
MQPTRDTDEMVDQVQQHLIANGLASPGDRIVLVYGAPISVRGRTNTVRVHQVSS